MKKKVWTLSPYFLIFSAAILGMAIYSFRWNIYIFYIEMVVAVVSIILVFFNLKRFHHYTARVVKSAVSNIKGVNVQYLEKFSIPVVVAGSQGDVIWYNSKFKTRLCSGREPTGDFISQYIPGTTVDDILDTEGADVAYGDKRYTVLIKTQRWNMRKAVRLWQWLYLTTGKNSNAITTTNKTPILL